ncbi:MAG TPA: hypothetical protein VFR29_00055 [Steroidobacteraceae bacterium]|nr:hypothetical protein [Steroidobacteraceae bacterium]
MAAARSSQMLCTVKAPRSCADSPISSVPSERKSAWRVGDRAEWTFPEFLILLLPAALLYVIARLCLSEKVAESDLRAHYLRVARTLFVPVAITYATFAFLLQPFDFGKVLPWVFASQLVLVVLAIVASRYGRRAFRYAAAWAAFADRVMIAPDRAARPPVPCPSSQQW